MKKGAKRRGEWEKKRDMEKAREGASRRRKCRATEILKEEGRQKEIHKSRDVSQKPLIPKEWFSMAVVLKFAGSDSHRFSRVYSSQKSLVLRVRTGGLWKPVTSINGNFKNL